MRTSSIPTGRCSFSDVVQASAVQSALLFKILGVKRFDLAVADEVDTRMVNGLSRRGLTQGRP
jgi:hypothetical protein